MNILMLVPFLPIDQMSGGQTRWYHIIKHLSRDHKITLMSLIKDDREKNYLPQIEKYCEKVYLFKRPKSPWTIRNLFLALISFEPLVVIRNFSLDERQAIKRELATGKYDIIHAEAFYVMPHIPSTKIPIVLVEQTIEYSVYEHYVNTEVSKFLKPIYMFDVIKLKFWEKFYWKKATKLLAVSEEDKQVMMREISRSDIQVSPNGVDVDFFNSKKVAKKVPPRILYHGNYKWMQNVEAANLLVREVWPRIKRKCKNVKLWISGRNIPSEIIEFSKHDPDIEISESIEDNRDIYKAAEVLVTPIRGPGGTRLKAIEAMASELPIVSTPIGVAGLGVTNGVHALVSSKMDDLADFVVKLLKDKNLAKKMGKIEQEYAKANFDWKIIVKALNRVYEQTRTINHNS